MILSALLAFAQLIGTVGLIIAITALVFISAAADPDHTWRRLLAIYMNLLAFVYISSRGFWRFRSQYSEARQMDMFSSRVLGFSEVMAPDTLGFCFLGVTAGMLIGALRGIGPMAAIFITTAASFFGSRFAIVCLAFFSSARANFALDFGSVEYFSLRVFGLITVSVVAPGLQIKGIAMVLVGLALGLVSTDITTGTSRFTFGFIELTDGITLVAVAMGVFCATEVIINLNCAKYMAMG